MNRKLLKSCSLVAVMVLLLAVSSGCRGGKDQAVNPDLTESDGGATTAESSRGGESLPEINEEWLFDSFTGLMPIYFDFDRYDLRPDALSTLRENAEKIKRVPGAIIQIEGHCDERGTQGYNLALGERRSLATRAHLMNLGVSGDRIITISYGEEDPVDAGHTEAAWAKNRRCEFNRAM